MSKGYEELRDLSHAGLRKLNEHLKYLYRATKNISVKDIQPGTGKVIDISQNPSLATLPTIDEKAALAGTSGSPGEGNRYVTDSDTRLLTGTTYEHSQVSPQLEWVIVHGLDRYPSVTVVDSGGAVVYGDVQYLSKDELRIFFSAEFSGKAYLN